MICTKCLKQMGKNGDVVRLFNKKDRKFKSLGYANLCVDCWPKFEKEFIKYLG